MLRKILTRIRIKVRIKKNKSASSISIIGGADGPTSIFIAGKSKNQMKMIEKRRSKIIAQLSSNPHTLSQLVEYITKKYGARKVSEEENRYKVTLLNVKSALVLKHRPELVSTPMPKELCDYKNKEKVEQYFRRIQKRNLEATNIKKEEFEVKFEQYIINVNEPRRKGTIQIDVEYKYDYLGVSYSCQGERADYGKIGCDIYEYYGVSKDDIAKRTDRLMQLVSCIEHTNSK
jgi:hypothetical protein